MLGETAAAPPGIIPPMTWEALFFDLDGTLYPLQAGLWQAVGERIERFLAEYLDLSLSEARRLRQRYGEQYGTVLRGLQEEYGLDPRVYLAYVNQVPVERYLRPDPRVRAMLQALPYPKWVFSNADRAYVYRVLRALHLEDVFAGVIALEDLDWVPKPHPQAFQRAWQRAGVRQPGRTWLIDDLFRNVQAAARLGMRAVWVTEEPDGSAGSRVAVPHIPHLLALPAVLEAAAA